MGHKTVEQLGREIESFQDEIRKLQHELSGLSRFTDPEKMKQKARHLKNALGDFRSHTQEKAEHIYQAVRQGGSTAVDRGRSTIEQKPVMSVLIAFGAGLLLSRFLGRTH